LLKSFQVLNGYFSDLLARLGASEQAADLVVHLKQQPVGQAARFGGVPHGVFSLPQRGDGSGGHEEKKSRGCGKGRPVASHETTRAVEG
jgi:hypothetical protein